MQRAPAELREVLELCVRARELSGGWFDPWSMPGGVDPTGLVKGWSTERAMAVLREGGAGAAVISAGGDVLAMGRPSADRPWRAGVRHPWRADALACVVSISGGLATSGSYERGPHLIEPCTGGPSGRSASASVTGEGLAMVDALATGVAVGGEEAFGVVSALDDYGVYLVLPDGAERATSNFPFADLEPGTDNGGRRPDGRPIQAPQDRGAQALPTGHPPGTD